MSGFQTFAITGAGNVGSPIIKNLVKAGKTVFVLSRSDSTKVEGTVIKVVDYSKPASLEAALSGVDVVISCFGMSPGAMDNQGPLAEAAKKAGVKLFVPTEFGNPTSRVTDGPLLGKRRFHDTLKALDLPYVLVFTGPFPEFCLVAPFGFDFKGGRISIVGAGETPIGWTAIPDVGYYLVRYLLETPAKDLEWSTLRVEGDRKSFKEIAATYEKLHPGAKVSINSTTVEDARKFLETPESHSVAGFFTYLLLSWEQGASPYNDGPLGSLKWPDYQPQTIEDVLKAIV